MFKRPLLYLMYRNATLKWLEKEGIDSKNVRFHYPWSKGSGYEEPYIAVCDSEPVFDKDKYVCIHRSNHFSLYEKKTLKNAHLLRQSFSKSLQTNLLVQIRKWAAESCAGEKLSQILPAVREKFKVQLEEQCTVDVSVWLDGQLRGSIVQQGTLINSIKRASKLVVADPRYKSLKPDDLLRARFELVVVPDVWISYHVQSDESMEEDVAMRLSYKGKRLGWFVPPVANQRAFKTVGEYLGALSRKSGVEHIDSRYIKFEMARALSCIESVSSKEVLPLRGAVPLAQEGSLNEKKIATNIVRAIDEDGYLCNVKEPGKEEVKSLDLVRQAMCTAALAEYHVYSNDSDMLDVIQKSAVFILKHINNLPEAQINRVLSVSYLTQTQALTGYDFKVSSESLQHDIGNLQVASEGEIIYQIQRVKACVLAGVAVDTQGTTFHIHTKMLYKRWLSETKPDPVVYADLLILLHSAGMKEEYKFFRNWLTGLQSEVGSFKCKHEPYVRGVGKIAEAFASVPDSSLVIQSALGWLSCMQYTEETMYHIPVSDRYRFDGGFRHDYWDRSLWIDGSAHVLLALIRGRYAQTYISRLQKCLQIYGHDLPG